MYHTVVCWLFLCLFAVSAQAENRHALVIGNSEYGSGFGLINPKNDSRDIAIKLQSIGYDVHGDGALQDLGIDDFNNEIDRFLDSVGNGSSTLIYYAGHGAASSGVNFLIPILPPGVKLRSETDIRNRAISLQSILEKVEQRNPDGVNVMFFDACRDAPVENFSRSINLTGLVDLDTRRQPRGSFIGFSTEYGMLALDDDQTGNSPFASAILNSLDDNATAPIELFYKSVTEEVYELTDGQQFPIQESKLRGDYCIVECSEIASLNKTTKKYGILNVVTDPVEAEVCVFAKGWETWNCDSNVPLPIDVPIKVKVTAKKHSPYITTTILRHRKQRLTANLEPNKNRAIKIVGAVVGILVTGALISGGSSSSGSSSNVEGPTTITLTRP